MLAQKINTEELYAMKILSKKSIIEQKQLEHTKNEHLVLKHVNHPFLVSLHCAFQSQYKLYFVMELMRGGELYCHLGKSRCFSEDQAKFFVACVILGLGHLHANSFVYRDLKLENVLLDDRGYAKLSDFGLSKFLKKNEKTNTICGTLYYIAPEIVNRKGHDFTVDWWSLGILTFEILYGVPPWHSKNERILLRAILTGNLVF